MTEYYSNIVASSLNSEIRFNEPGSTLGTSKFQLAIDYRDAILDPVLVSTDLNLTALLSVGQYDQAPALEDILLEYNGDEGQWIDASTLTNPGISITSLSLTGSLSSVGPGPGSTPYVTSQYTVTFTIDSQLTSSTNSQNWINFLIQRNFRLRVSENFINQVENAGYTVTTTSFTFNAFDTNVGTPPAPTFLSQPQNTNHSIIEGSIFTVEYRWYDANSQDQTWQYSDNYDENNPELATWTDITSENSIGAISQISFTLGDLQDLIGTTAASPTVYSASSSMTVYSWAPGRKFRYKLVVT